MPVYATKTLLPWRKAKLRDVGYIPANEEAHMLNLVGCVFKADPVLAVLQDYVSR